VNGSASIPTIRKKAATKREKIPRKIPPNGEQKCGGKEAREKNVIFGGLSQAICNNKKERRRKERGR